MSRHLSVEDLLAGASTVHEVELPPHLASASGKLAGAPAEEGSVPETVSLRPLTLRDVQRITKAAHSGEALTSTLMVQQALVDPKLTVEEVGALPAGLARFLLEQVKARQGHRLGIVIMDFPSQEIIEAIVMSNRFLRE